LTNFNWMSLYNSNRSRCETDSKKKNKFE